ncbi:MAG: hypothetical protein KAV82_03695 [Phycisphaerae bacterium]|nr:hypothetical protein [Phycisphaerae bacterium]
MSLQEDLDDLIGYPVALDTTDNMIYLGTLRRVTENSFELVGADVHDCRDGHASREAYIIEAGKDGISINRRRVFVLRSVVCSISRLDHVLTNWEAG